MTDQESPRHGHPMGVMREELHRDTTNKLKDLFDRLYERAVNTWKLKEDKLAAEASKACAYVGQVLAPYLRDLEIEELQKRLAALEGEDLRIARAVGSKG